MKWIALAILGCSMAVMAQSAKVIALTSKEARQAKFMQDQVDIAIKRQKDFYESLQRKYTQSMTMECSMFSGYALLSLGSNVITLGAVDEDGKSTPPPPKPPPCEKKPQYHSKPGWDDGFRYSEDFKYIVPIEPKQSNYGNCGMLGCSPILAY